MSRNTQFIPRNGLHQAVAVNLQRHTSKRQCVSFFFVSELVPYGLVQQMRSQTLYEASATRPSCGGCPSACGFFQLVEIAADVFSRLIRKVTDY
jgi:hypothetical protein